MKLCLIALFLTAFAVSVAISEKTSYQNYRLLRLIPKNSDHVKLLNNLEYNTDVSKNKRNLNNYAIKRIKMFKTY